MKKSLLLLATSFLCSSLFAQHYEWTCAQINNNQVFESTDAAVAAGCQTIWGYPQYIGIPAQNLIENDLVKVSLPFAYNYASTGNSKFSGYSKSAYKLIVGSSLSAGNIIADLGNFLDGVEGNAYCSRVAASDQGNDVMNSMIKIEVAPKAEGIENQTAAITVRWNRGDNNASLYVIDWYTKIVNETEEVVTELNTKTTAHLTSGYNYDHVTRFNVQQGHTYYVMTSKGNVELYSIAYDNSASDQYAVLASEDNSTSLWTTKQINNNQVFETVDAVVAAGYQTIWGSPKYIGIPAQSLIDNESVKVSLPFAYNYAGVGNSKWPEYTNSAYKLIVGSTLNAGESVTPAAFADGVNGNDYCSKISTSDQGNDVMNSMLKIDVPDAAGGRVILNYSRGDNKLSMYVIDVDTTKSELEHEAERYSIACQDVAQSPKNGDIKAQSIIFNVQHGHMYYVMTSKGNVELYAVGYCTLASDKYGNLEATTSLSTIDSKPGFEKDVMYNILGQRVNGNAKGIVIMNGKKMLVK